jgi:hypothetical protein
MTMKPNSDGPIYDDLPICVVRDVAGEIVCALFSIACHPSVNDGFAISAEYPGVAMTQIDAAIGKECALFLQGAGGDAKPAHIGDNPERWRIGDWNDTAIIGGQAAKEVLDALDGLKPVLPRVATACYEMTWPLEAPLERAGYEAVVADPYYDLHAMWAQRQIERLDRYGTLPDAAPLTIQAVQLGERLRIVGIEGELVAELGMLVRDYFGAGITFPLGYTNGEGLYLPTFAQGVEGHLQNGLKVLRDQGIT